jgi:hypothetical protein
VEAGSILVERELPIDGALVGACLLRLRRDAVDRRISWTLGGHGSADLDVHFHRAAGDAVPRTDLWSTTCRLWERDRLAATTVIVELRSSAGGCELVVRASGPIPPVWRRDPQDLRDLARAMVDELGEELRWHASRPDAAASGT